MNNTHSGVHFNWCPTHDDKHLTNLLIVLDHFRLEIDYVLGPSRERIYFRYEDILESNKYDNTETWKVKLQHTGTFAKVKKLNAFTGHRGCFMKEVVMNQQLVHENILQYLGQRCETQDGGGIFMTEYPSRGSVHDLLRNEPALFDNNMFFKFSIEAAHALDYLHTRDDPVVHGDIRSKNFFVTENKTLKLGEFRYAKVTRHADTVSKDHRVEEESRWQAPEVILDEEISRKSDVWALHVFFMEMITKDYPFKDVKLRVQAAIKERIYVKNEKPYNITLVPRSIQNLIENGLKIRPEERPNI